MNKKSIIALLVALFIPVFCYLVLKYFSENAANTPRKLLLDGTEQREENGKIITDSIWHKTGNIRFVNQLGDTVSLYELQGKPIVIDLFFTQCAGICPRLTRSMKTLQQSFKTGGKSRVKLDTTVVHFLSISIDPENDSVAQLKSYADRFGINADNWWMVTGNRDSIYNFIFEELKIDKISAEKVDPDFAHTSRFALLDRNLIQRGRFTQPYNGLDSASISLLARDIGLLMLEKDKTKRNTIFTKIIDLSWLWLLIAVCVAGFFWYFKRGRKKDRY